MAPGVVIATIGGNGDKTVPANTLLRSLTLAPSSAWIEKVGVDWLSSRTKRTWLALRSALVNVGASTHVVPSAVVWNTPWVTFDTVDVKLLLSGSLMRMMLPGGANVIGGNTSGGKMVESVKEPLENGGETIAHTGQCRPDR